MITHIHNEQQFNEEVKKGLVIVDFYADWCGPCKMLAPELEKLDEEEQVSILKINVDELPTLARKFGIMNIPTLLLYKEGEIKNKKLGYMPVSALKEFIK